MSQDEVAANSNKLTKATISDIENGKRNFSFTTFLDLSRGLGKEPKELVDFDFELEKE
ncbi:helix-turn-helix protein [compost metagenome]